MIASAASVSVGLHRMRMDFPARLRNTDVAVTHALVPVFEAIVNSIHSIEDRFGFEEAATKGRIVLQVHRDLRPQPPSVPGRPQAAPVAGFTIVDNGVGFTDRNLVSFETADSRFKIERGGKGIGRLTWLVVFNKVVISSQFQAANGQHTRRSFTFAPEGSGISDFAEEPLHNEAVETRIRLDGVQPRYWEALRKSRECIAERVFEHCLSRFAVGKCPRVTVTEGSDSTEELVVNDAVRELAVSSAQVLSVGGHHLKLRHVQQQHAAKRKHLGHLVADDRVVSTFPLSEVSDLSTDSIPGDGGRVLVHHALVSGRALDAAVATNRTSFDLPDNEPIPAAGGLLDLKAVRDAVGQAVNHRLGDILTAEREAKLQRVERHIRTKQPEYGQLLTKRRAELARIQWADDPVQRDEALYRVKRRWELEIRQQQSEVERTLVGRRTDVEDIAEQLDCFLSGTNLSGAGDLVRYGTKRRAVLKILKKLVKQGDGVWEKHIGRIVFPLRKMTGEVDYEYQNLWLINDSFSFYEFLSSDILQHGTSAAPSNGRKRPDILAFKTGDPLQRVSLVKFKRPDQKVDKNPVRQLAEYARLLRNGGAAGADGSTLPAISTNTPIDAYAIVTLRSQMESLVRYGPGEMRRVEGEGRWYGYVGSLNMNVEVLDHRAFLRRAQQRSQALFA